MKKILSILFVYLFAFTAFAQFSEARCAGLTDSDVKNFCANCVEIEKELNKVNISLSDQSSLTADEKTLKKMNKTLNKYGISGDEPFEKIKAIYQCYTVETYDKSISGNPDAEAITKVLGVDPVALMRNFTHPQDCAVVKRHMAELEKAFANFYEQ